MSLFAAVFVGGMAAWFVNYVDDKQTEKELKQMYLDKYGSEWDDKPQRQGVVQTALGYGESPTLYYNEAETIPTFSTRTLKKYTSDRKSWNSRDKIVIDRSDVDYYFNFRMTEQDSPMSFVVTYNNDGTFDFKVGEVMDEEAQYYTDSFNYIPEQWMWLEQLQTEDYVVVKDNIEYTPHLPTSSQTMVRSATVFQGGRIIPEGGAKLEVREVKSIPIFLKNPRNKAEVKFFEVFFKDMPTVDRRSSKSDLLVEIKDMSGHKMIMKASILSEEELEHFVRRAEQEIVSGDKRGKVISMIGSDPRLRKLTKDKDITPEEAAKRLEISAEQFAVEFDDWAEQEMKTHGYNISFREWAEEESGSHGDIELLDWAQHEEESHDARYDAESYKPPASAVANAKRGLALRKEFGRGGLSPSEAKSHGIDSGVTRARKIASGKVSRHDVRRMSAFNRHRKNYRPEKKMPDGGPTAGTIAWLLWGGTSGVNWAKKKSAAMNAETIEDDADFRRRVLGGGDLPEELVKQVCLFCECDEDDELLVEVMLDGYPELICESCMDPNNWAAEDMNWGGDPDGQLAKALAKAREDAKKPRRPLKITKLPHPNQKSLKDFEEFNSAVVYKRPKGIVAQVMAREKALNDVALTEALLELEQYIRLGMISEEEAFRKIVQMSQ